MLDALDSNRGACRTFYVLNASAQFVVFTGDGAGNLTTS
jgi:hypothetical protein